MLAMIGECAVVDDGSGDEGYWCDDRCWGIKDALEGRRHPQDVQEMRNNYLSIA